MIAEFQYKERCKHDLSKNHFLNMPLPVQILLCTYICHVSIDDRILISRQIFGLFRVINDSKQLISMFYKIIPPFDSHYTFRTSSVTSSVLIEITNQFLQN